MPAPNLEETPLLAPDVHELLLKTVWGTPGHGALYKIADLDFFDSFPSVAFHNLRDDLGHLKASRFFRRHPIRIAGHTVQAIYHSFSAVPPELQGQGFGGQLAAASRDNLIQKLGPDGGLIYAYVERDNLRNAQNLRKAGYEAVGEFWTGCLPILPHSSRPTFASLEPKDIPQLRDLYTAAYADFAFVDSGERSPAMGIMYSKRMATSAPRCMRNRCTGALSVWAFLRTG